MKTFGLCIFLLIFTTQGYSEGVPNRLIGRPITKASCEAGTCNHEKLTEVGQAKYELAIVSSGDQFFWTSREGKPLEHYVSGAYDYYINPEGSGYVKTTHLEGDCQYMEHVTIGLQTITYWGSCQG